MRIRGNRAKAIGLAIVVLLCSNLNARPGEEWPYDKLFKHADLVLIAKPLSVRDAKKEDKAAPPRGYADLLTGVVTSLRVLQVVKGEYKSKEMDMVHYRYKKALPGSGNGPRLVDFNAKGRIGLPGGGAAGMKPGEYLLFLKKDRTGRFMPVSGQVDPGPSVKRILEASP